MTQAGIRRYIYEWLEGLGIGPVYQDFISFDDASAVKKNSAYVVYFFNESPVDEGPWFRGLLTVVIGCRDKRQFTADLKTLDEACEKFVQAFDHNDPENGFNIIDVDESEYRQDESGFNHECVFVCDVFASKSVEKPGPVPPPTPVTPTYVTVIVDGASKTYETSPNDATIDIWGVSAEIKDAHFTKASQLTQGLEYSSINPSSKRFVNVILEGQNASFEVYPNEYTWETDYCIYDVNHNPKTKASELIEGAEYSYSKTGKYGLYANSTDKNDWNIAFRQDKCDVIPLNDKGEIDIFVEFQKTINYALCCVICAMSESEVIDALNRKDIDAIRNSEIGFCKVYDQGAVKAEHIHSHHFSTACLLISNPDFAYYDTYKGLRVMVTVMVGLSNEKRIYKVSPEDEDVDLYTLTGEHITKASQLNEGQRYKTYTA